MKDGVQGERKRRETPGKYRREASRASLLGSAPAAAGAAVQDATDRERRETQSSGRSEAEILDGRPSGGYPGFSSDRAKRHRLPRREPPLEGASA
jgi:hypothetical protein